MKVYIFWAQFVLNDTGKKYGYKLVFINERRNSEIRSVL